jgi:hypothetical protein
MMDSGQNHAGMTIQGRRHLKFSDKKIVDVLDIRALIPEWLHKIK